MLIGITTSPRPKRYLRQTVYNLLLACERVPLYIVISPNFEDPEEEWGEISSMGRMAETNFPRTIDVLDPLEPRTLAEHNALLGVEDWFADNPYASEWEHRGLQRNTDRLIAHLVESGEKFFVTAQDDLVSCRHAVDRMAAVAERLKQPDMARVGAVSFYSPYIEFGTQGKPLVDYPGEKFYGEVCLLWRAAAAAAFLPRSNHNEAHDLEVARFFRESGWKLMAHFPCLVQHVGIESARGDTRTGNNEQTMNFYQVMDAMEAMPLD